MDCILHRPHIRSTSRHSQGNGKEASHVDYHCTVYGILNKLVFVRAFIEGRVSYQHSHLL
jgi:hypothetical protein